MGRSKRGIVGTTLFHGIILVIIVFFGFMVPDPPPDEEGILINFGTDDAGLGMEEPAYTETPQQTPPPPQEESTPVESSEEIISQDFEEAPAVEPVTETLEQEEVQETPVEKVLPEAEETPPPPEEEPPKVNERALYKGRAADDNASSSEGITEGDGNQGNINGSPDSDNYLDGLGGRGIDFSLAGRSPLSLPKPEYNVQEAGTVVVKIRVNRDGVVTWAEAGAQGTNTLNKELLEAARKAALKARFNRSPDAAYTQQGTITYHFVLD
jgi:TonB family protein